MQRKNHTFTRRICNTQITNTLRTLRECVSNGLQMCPNVLRMCGEHVYTGTINLPLRLLTDCQMCPQRFTNVWRARIHGRNKSAPTAADSLPIMLLTDCNNTTFKKQKPYFRNVKTPFLQFKKVVFAIQKSSFCNLKRVFFADPKECFLQTKKVVFVDPKV